MAGLRAAGRSLCAATLRASGRHYRPLNVAFVGAPGVGKGTYGRLLLPKLGVAHVSSGDLLRALVASGRAPDGLAETMAQGMLAPDDVVMEVCARRLSQEDARERGTLLDGVPRHVGQIAQLAELVHVDAVLHLTMDPRYLLQKAVARRTCESCGHGYNVAHIMEGAVRMPALLPKVEGVCDRCQGRLVQRADDTEPVVRERLRLYEETTAPIVLCYQALGVPVVKFELTSGAADMLPPLEALCRRHGWMLDQREVVAPAVAQPAQR